MLDQGGEVTCAMPTNPMTAYRPQGERNDVLLSFGLCRGHHTATPEARAATLHEVGDLVGVTKDRLREIQDTALTKVRRLSAEPS